MTDPKKIETYIKKANNGMKEKMPDVRKAVKIYEKNLKSDSLTKVGKEPPLSNV